MTIDEFRKLSLPEQIKLIPAKKKNMPDDEDYFGLSDHAIYPLEDFYINVR